MKVLVVGSGAREHALVWKLRASPGVTDVLAAPGNAGIAALARTFDVPAERTEGIVGLAVREGVDFVVVGPEAPLVLGLVDALAEEEIPAFGPTAAAARLEGSKVFAKEFMARHGVPTAPFRVFSDPGQADAYVRERGAPIVVKADGLAAGKGVVVAASVEEAHEAIENMMVERAFGDAGARIVIEHCLVGPEVSYHVVSDGERYVALAAAQDHKRLLAGDKGPNTGGMGAYSPPPVVTPAVERAILERIVEPTLRGMKSEGVPFRGALFVGAMIVEGEPMTLEYNVRFGDPETEVIMARLGGDVLPLLFGSARGDLRGVEPVWDAPAAMAIVVAAAGYPGTPKRGDAIGGVEKAEAGGARVFHAGTRVIDGRLVSAGGRVLAVTATGGDVDEAAARAYAGVGAIELAGAQHRADIGWQARKR